MSGLAGLLGVPSGHALVIRVSRWSSSWPPWRASNIGTCRAVGNRLLEDAAPRTQLEDQSRKVAPLRPASSICRLAREKPQAPRAGCARADLQAGIPAFDDGQKVLPRAATCTEYNVFDDKALAAARPRAVAGAYADGRSSGSAVTDQVVWLGSRNAGGTVGVLWASSRSEHFAELYA